jgi:Zn-dependent protease
MEQLLIALPVLIFSVVIHEYAHGWMAYREGDQTAAMLGRLTFNPIPHLDPVGSLLVPGLLALMPGGIIFGWARPVPVNPRNFRNYRRGDILVSLAGVAANLLVAIACTFLLALAIWLGHALPGGAESWGLVQRMLQFGILINLVLIVFNLIPIPPLDGSHVLVHFLPPAAAMRYREMGRYGMILVLAFLFLGGFRLIAVPIFTLFSWMRSFAIQLGSLPL